MYGVKDSILHPDNNIMISIQGHLSNHDTFSGPKSVCIEESTVLSFICLYWQAWVFVVQVAMMVQLGLS